MIMMIFQYKILLLGYGNEEFEDFESISVDAFGGATQITSFNSDFSNKHGYLISLLVNETFPSNQYVSMYKGSNT